MEQFHFAQLHPSHFFEEDDNADYSQRDEHFIQCLKALENIMDIDAYIIDYKKQRVLYATKGCTLHSVTKNEKKGVIDFTCLDNMIFPEYLPIISTINSKVYEFAYSLPINRRMSLYFTQDYFIKTKYDKKALINHKGTVLDLTVAGALRLTLCVITLPTHDKPGNSYIKMLDTNTVYEFMPSSQKFVEVKTQRLTSKATEVLKLASSGKSEAEIAKALGITIHTVKYHKRKIFAQIGVKKTAKAVQWMNNQKKMIRR